MGIFSSVRLHVSMHVRTALKFTPCNKTRTRHQNQNDFQRDTIILLGSPSKPIDISVQRSRVKVKVC